MDWDASERSGAAALLSLTEVPCLTKALCSLEGWSLSEALEVQSGRPMSKEPRGLGHLDLPQYPRSL